MSVYQYSTRVLCIIVALENLKSDDQKEDRVRQNAAGALWILGNRDQPQNRTNSARGVETGLYIT